MEGGRVLHPVSDSAGTPGPAWLVVLARLGRALFSLAVIGIGVETLVCAYIAGHSLAPHHQVVPVIPWAPAIPGLVYPLGLIWVVCGMGLLFRRAAVVSSIALGALMVLCGLAFDVPRHPDLMNAEWRTNVLEPIAIGCMAWLGFGWGGVPEWLRGTGRYLLALALVVFGIAHFQVLDFIAPMVPGWIPWHRFWTLFSGVAFIAAGVSFATGWLERWAALALGLMFALWLLTIHLPPVLNFFRTPGAPQDPDKWSDVLIVAALWGGSWALALALGWRESLRSGAASDRG
jgi:uncharacterized membrane protein